MPAARDVDWTHVKVVGDRDAAMPYISYGRKLLGFVKEQAAYSHLGVHQVAKTLVDGTVVIAEIRGKIPRITIKPAAPGGRPKLLIGLDRFVVYARKDGLLSGIDEDYPEQWLDAPGVTRTDGWLTRFYDGSTEAFEAFEEPKAAYHTIRSCLAFPDGVLHYGNVDHRNKDGYRVSWCGPSSRMFNDAYVNPAVIFRSKVFMHGEVLLDVGTDVVYGAGIRGNALLVVQGTAIALPVPPVAPSYPPGVGYVTGAVAISTAGAKLRVCKYALLHKAVIGQRVEFTADAASQEILLETSWEDREFQPWFFNPDCTEASSFSSSSSAGGFPACILRRVEDTVGGHSFEFTNQSGGGGTPVPPATTDYRYTLTIGSKDERYVSEIRTSTSSIPAGAGTALLARDYDEDGERVELHVVRSTVASEAGILSFSFGELTWPLQERTGATEVTRRYLLHADLPQGTLVFAVCAFAYTPPGGGGHTYTDAGGSVRVEVWRRGELVGNVAVSSASLDTGLRHNAPLMQADRGYTVWEVLNSVALAPSYAIYGVAQVESDNIDAVVTDVSVVALGGAAMYAFFAYPTSYSFSFYRYVYGGGDIKFDVDRTAFYDHEIDRDSSYTPFSCATLGNHTLFSGYPLVAGDEAASLSWADEGADDDRTLQSLTGVSGAHQRYHPLWRLGRFDLLQPQGIEP